MMSQNPSIKAGLEKNPFVFRKPFGKEIQNFAKTLEPLEVRHIGTWTLLFAKRPLNAWNFRRNHRSGRRAPRGTGVRNFWVLGVPGEQQNADARTLGSPTPMRGEMLCVSYERNPRTALGEPFQIVSRLSYRLKGNRHEDVQHV